MTPAPTALIKCPECQGETGYVRHRPEVGPGIATWFAYLENGWRIASYDTEQEARNAVRLAHWCAGTLPS